MIHVTPVRYNWRVRPLPWLKRTMSRISLRVQTYLALEARRSLHERLASTEEAGFVAAWTNADHWAAVEGMQLFSRQREG